MKRFGCFGELVLPSRDRRASSFGFMTAADEKSLAEAARSLDRSGHSTPAPAIRGEVRGASPVCIETRLRLGAGAHWATWRSCPGAAARMLQPGGAQPAEEHVAAATAGSTFLHTIAALLAECEGASRGRRPFLYGRTERWLRWTHARDGGTEEELRNRGVVAGGAEVWGFDAAIEARGITAASRFRLWHSPASGRRSRCGWSWRRDPFFGFVCKSCRATLPPLRRKCAPHWKAGAGWIQRFLSPEAEESLTASAA